MANVFNRQNTKISIKEKNGKETTFELLGQIKFEEVKCNDMNNHTGCISMSVDFCNDPEMVKKDMLDYMGRLYKCYLVTGEYRYVTDDDFYKACHRNKSLVDIANRALDRNDYLISTINKLKETVNLYKAATGESKHDK